MQLVKLFLMRGRPHARVNLMLEHKGQVAADHRSLFSRKAARLRGRYLKKSL